MAPQELSCVPVGHTQGLARAQHTEGPPETQHAPYAGPGEELVVQDSKTWFLPSGVRRSVGPG